MKHTSAVLEENCFEWLRAPALPSGRSRLNEGGDLGVGLDDDVVLVVIALLPPRRKRPQIAMQGAHSLRVELREALGVLEDELFNEAELEEVSRVRGIHLNVEVLRQARIRWCALGTA